MSTSTVLAPILSRQFSKLQAPPFHWAPNTGVPVRLMARPIATPLKADAWSKAPDGHPNPKSVASLLKGMQHGLQMAFRKTDHAGPAPATPPQHTSTAGRRVQPRSSLAVLRLFPRKPQASGE